MGGPHQHRHAGLLLRHFRHPAARRGDREDQGLDPQDLRQTRRDRVERNFAAVDQSLAALREVRVPGRADFGTAPPPVVRARRPDFVQRVTAMMLDGKGDLLPVSALPDGRHLSPPRPRSGRSAASPTEIPIWDAAICTQCDKCALVCPHAAIRMNVYSPDSSESAPGGPSRACPGGQGRRRVAGWAYTLQGGAGRLHRLRHLRGHLPDAQQGEGQTRQGDQHGAQARPPRGRAAQLRVLPRAAGDAPAGTRSMRSKARSCARRCSSTPAPAPAAARRRT